MIEKVDAKKAGDINIAGPGATIVSRSLLIESMNRTGNEDPELAQALKNIAIYIERSGNPAAARLFDELNKKIAAGEDKSILRALWDGVVKIVPDIASLGEATVKIASFLA